MNDPAAPSVAARITQGVCRHFAALNWATLTEFRLGNQRRADVCALDPRGRVVIVEVKSGPADFRSDGKWHEYAPYCDGFAFAVAPDFPLALLPEDVGVLITDGWQARLLRPWTETPLHASRRKAVTLSFARAAALRLAGRAEGDAL